MYTIFLDPQNIRKFHVLNLSIPPVRTVLKYDLQHLPHEIKIQFPSQLQPNSHCGNYRLLYGDAIISDNKMCAAAVDANGNDDYTVDACQGDSGGTRTVRFVNIAENGMSFEALFRPFPSSHHIKKLMACWLVHMEHSVL